MNIALVVSDCWELYDEGYTIDWIIMNIEKRYIPEDHNFMDFSFYLTGKKINKYNPTHISEYLSLLQKHIEKTKKYLSVLESKDLLEELKKIKDIVRSGVILFLKQLYNYQTNEETERFILNSSLLAINDHLKCQKKV